MQGSSPGRQGQHLALTVLDVALTILNLALTVLHSLDGEGGTQVRLVPPPDLKVSAPVT